MRMMRQVIRQSQIERQNREFDEKVATVLVSWMAGILTGLIFIKLFWG